MTTLNYLIPRKEGESISIGTHPENVATVTVESIGSKEIYIKISAPEKIRVWRKEDDSYLLRNGVYWMGKPKFKQEDIRAFFENEAINN